MRAIQQRSFGGPEELRLVEVPDPHPAAGQVRIRVESAGVHVVDTVVRRGGSAGPAGPQTLPAVPGREVAGVVDEVGAGVDAGLAGRRVVVSLGEAGGGYAELALAPAGEVHLVPENLDADAAVAMIGTGRTALAVLELAAPAAGDVALVTAAAGGIGTLLVQAERAAGAAVVGLASGEQKLALVRDLGAAVTVDYSRPSWPEQVQTALAGRPVTLVLDGVGGEAGRAALELLGVGGRLVMFGMSSGSLPPLSAEDVYRYGITVCAAVGARLVRRPGGLRPLAEQALAAAAGGTLTPVIGTRFPLAEAAAAHTAIESRATLGKVVLHP